MHVIEQRVPKDTYRLPYWPKISFKNSLRHSPSQFWSNRTVEQPDPSRRAENIVYVIFWKHSQDGPNRFGTNWRHLCLDKTTSQPLLLAPGSTHDLFSARRQVLPYGSPKDSDYRPPPRINDVVSVVHRSFCSFDCLFYSLTLIVRRCHHKFFKHR